MDRPNTNGGIDEGDGSPVPPPLGQVGGLAGEQSLGANTRIATAGEAVNTSWERSWSMRPLPFVATPWLPLNARHRPSVSTRDQIAQGGRSHFRPVKPRLWRVLQ